MRSSLRILGHRGAILPKGPFYQNSLTAFREALTVADGLETDACVSADGEVFLLHEAKYVSAEAGVEYIALEHLDEGSALRMGTRRLDEVAAAELRTFCLKDGSPLPSLRQLLDLARPYPRALLNVELKADRVGPAVLRTLMEDVFPVERVMLSSFNHAALQEVREDGPRGLEVGALFIASDTPAAPLYPWHPERAGAYTPLTAETLAAPLLQRIQPEWVIVPDMSLTEENVRMIAEALPQARVAAWWFTEREGDDPDSLIRTAQALRPTGKLGALIVDNPRRYAPLLHG